MGQFGCQVFRSIDRNHCSPRAMHPTLPKVRKLEQPTKRLLPSYPTTVCNDCNSRQDRSIQGPGHLLGFWQKDHSRGPVHVARQPWNATRTPGAQQATKQTRPTATAHWRHLDPSGGGAVHFLAERGSFSALPVESRAYWMLDVLTMAR